TRDAPQGRFVLRVGDGAFLHSQPMLLEPGGAYTLSGWARAVSDENAGKTLGMTIHPVPRWVGNVPFNVGVGGAQESWWRAPLEREWKRFSFTITLPDYRKGGFDYWTPWWWDHKSWWLYFEGPAPYELDGISVTEGREAPQGFVGESAVSVGVDIPDLPPYNPTGRLLERGATVTARAGLCNTADAAVNATARWELLDYAGKKVFDTAEERVALGAGETLLLTRKQALDANGTLLLRCTVLDADGAVLGQSHAPATVLPFPKAATTIDARERFGGTYGAGAPAADHFMTDVAQKVGLRWTRWYPRTMWQDVQPDGPDQWKLPMDIYEAQQSRGIACNLVLHEETPQWARGRDKNLPKDMEWPADDPRWDDLTIETSWDKFVKGMLHRFPGPGYAWEVINEPEWRHWNHDQYFQFVKRTHRIIKAIDPKALVMIDSVNGYDGISQGFLARGGAEHMDVFTFHNYTSGGFADAGFITSIKKSFERKDGTRPQVWFNEGWTWLPSSHNSFGRGMLSNRAGADGADIFVRAHGDTMAAGMEKMIYFNMSYPTHGRSWWDWAGDGTMFWDDHDDPVAALPALNVMIEMFGLSDSLGSIRSADAWMHVFHDLRNNRGVALVWAADGGKAVELPIPGLQVADIMANPERVEHLPATTRFALTSSPVYVFKPGLSGAELFGTLKKLERPAMDDTSQGVYTIPRDWMARGAAGNPYPHNGQPLWSLVRLIPADFSKPANYVLFDKFVETQGKWEHSNRMQGGQPGVVMNKESELEVEIRSWWGGAEFECDKPSGFVFHAPENGRYDLDAGVHLWRWEGGSRGFATVVMVDGEAGASRQITRVEIPANETTPVEAEGVWLNKGQRLAVIYSFEGPHTGGRFTLKSLDVTRK
ncbi:MAG: cellulase family glycosylhydrolase, partial [Kiritimatiellaeota bacterium]|nr:cellulase family glycosylhydrolase [Kiritimatiellota bacterium]